MEDQKTAEAQKEWESKEEQNSNISDDKKLQSIEELSKFLPECDAIFVMGAKKPHLKSLVDGRPAELASMFEHLFKQDPMLLAMVESAVLVHKIKQGVSS